MSAHYTNAIKYIATQGYATLEAIDLIANLWHTTSAQVLADIEAIRKGEMNNADSPTA
jgi:hypothetical protein